MVAVTQALHIGSRSKNALLVALLLAPALAVVVPPAGASIVTCLADISQVVVSPMFAEKGQRVTIRVFTIDNNTIPEPPNGQNKIGIRVTVARPEGGNILDNLGIQGDVGVPILTDFTVPTDAGDGRGAISIKFDAPSDPQTYCNVPPDLTYLWGYWAGVKPDLLVPDNQAFFVRHTDGDDPSPLNGGVHPTLAVHDPPPAGGLNFTRYDDVPTGPCQDELLTPDFRGRMHVRVRVQNGASAGADFFAQPDATKGMLPLLVRVFQGSTLVASQDFVVSIPKGEKVDLVLNSTTLSLVNRTGPQKLRVVLDPLNVYADADKANNVYNASEAFGSAETPNPVHIRAPDLVAGLKDLELTSGKKVRGKANMTNLGDSYVGTSSSTGVNDNLCFSRNDGPVWLRVYVDKVDAAHEIANRSADLQSQAGTGDVSFESTTELGAGVHKIIAVADAAVGTLADNANELNESNNRVEAFLNVTDLLAPTIHKVSVPATGGVGAAINISGNVTDDADFTLDPNLVHLDVTYPNGTLFQFTVPKVNSAQGGYLALNPTNKKDVHFWFNVSYPIAGEYQVRLRANDTLHETIFPLLAAPPLKFLLTEFSKAMELISVEACDGNVLGQEQNCFIELGNSTSPQPAHKSFNGTNMARVRFIVPNGATGLGNEHNNVSRKSVEVRDPDARLVGNFTPQAICFNNVTKDYTSNCALAEVGCGPTQLCWVNAFEILVGNNKNATSIQSPPVPPACEGIVQNGTTTLPVPAQYNLTVWVGDSGCRFRGHTPDSLARPVRQRFALWDGINATVNKTVIVSGASVNALSPVQFRTDAYDNIRVNRTFVRVLRNNVEVLLQDLSFTSGNSTSGNGTYARSFPTGIYTDLDQHGAYQWAVGAQDANRTLSWNVASGSGETTCTPDYTGCTVTTRTFNLVDTRLPTASDEGAFLVGSDGAIDTIERTAVQVGETFVVQANADDDTRIAVRAIVQNAAGAEVLSVPMDRIAGQVHRSANITTGAAGNLTEGEYRLLVRVTDSKPNSIETLPQAFRVASNLPPTFSQRTPPDKGFGPPNTTVRVDVSDTLQGVLASSVTARFKVNAGSDIPVTPQVVTQEQNAASIPTVVRVSFQLPSSGAGSVRHGDNVTVTVAASEAGASPLNDSATWSFKVDALAPRSTLQCSKSFPAACGAEGSQSLRGDADVTLSAEDPDPEGKARSDVASLRYAIDAASTSGTLVTALGNTTTFRLNTLATGGDGFYTLRFRAVDRAGNEEPERRVLFALDSLGPAISNILVTPTAAGWNLTATVRDPASEVRTARAFVRAGATAFDESPLTRVAGTEFWTANLPGARRGQQVCYYLEATDNLDNVASSGTAASPVCFASENHPPSLTVLSPREGESIAAALTVRWQVSDLDTDPITVSVALRREGESQFLPVALTTEEQGQRTKTIDAATLTNGKYAVRVEAADNQPFNNRTSRIVNVTVGGEGSPDLTRPVFKTVVGIGEPFTVTVEIARAATNVEAVLLRDGREVAREPMDQDPPGSRTYVATFRVSEPGVYTVEVHGEYLDNGQAFTIRGASTLTVRGADNLLELAVLGFLGAAVVVMAALGLRRRGWV